MKPFLLLAIIFIYFSCDHPHLISDPEIRANVERDFQLKKQELSQGQLFDIFHASLTQEEKEALTFLYAYMPLGDITDYSGAYHLMNVRYALRAREEMPWGKNIPEREFRHFVLPVRVNNENLDESRKVFYEELKDRVKSLSLYDAVLEVNHWCHEKVIYTPSDERTSSPLASVKTAYGRCGEESTFLVAALRAVGIPARQVYTPRWAHTDDNHAWVEAWVDGQWHFLGACEPEPVLDLGWFNAPASRGMLMHTKVFGRYDGPEEVMSITPGYTEINVIENYAPAQHAQVFVTDTKYRPVAQAQVDFKIYNYAEFYTVASKTTDIDGKVSLTAGKGDMLVWASKNGKFGFGKLSFAQDSSVTIVLNKNAGETYSLPIDIVPPQESKITVQVTAVQRAANDRRMAEEDSIRNVYTATFMNARRSGETARQLDIDSSVLTPLLIGSRGNHSELVRFLTTTSTSQRPQALRLLQVISDKDLRDTPADVLKDHLNHTPASTSALFDFYVMNPRIANEMLTAYKAFFQKNLSETLVAQIKNNPDAWTQWCRDSIRINNDLNTQSIPVMPAGVWKARTADEKSRNIFYVAVLRSLGIPSRIDGVTGKIQYAGPHDQWVDVNFQAMQPTRTLQGVLTAGHQPVQALPDPQYYSHYTLSRFGNGRFQLLNFPEGESSSWDHLLHKGISLDTGYYMLTTGTRLASGGVLSNLTFFNIQAGKNTQIDLVMRENPEEVKVIGNLNSEATFLPKGKTNEQSILQTTGRGYFIVGILGARQEPTNHALRDIAALKNEFEQWGRGMVLLFPSASQLNSFQPEEFPALPKNVTLGTDVDNRIQKMITENMKLSSETSLPIFVIADTFNRVVYVQQGYSIGLGEQLMKVIHKL